MGDFIFKLLILIRNTKINLEINFIKKTGHKLYLGIHF